MNINNAFAQAYSNCVMVDSPITLSILKTAVLQLKDKSNLDITITLDFPSDLSMTNCSDVYFMPTQFCHQHTLDNIKEFNKSVFQDWIIAKTNKNYPVTNIQHCQYDESQLARSIGEQLQPLIMRHVFLSAMASADKHNHEQTVKHADLLDVLTNIKDIDNYAIFSPPHYAKLFDTLLNTPLGSEVIPNISYYQTDALRLNTIILIPKYRNLVFIEFSENLQLGVCAQNFNSYNVACQWPFLCWVKDSPKIHVLYVDHSIRVQSKKTNDDSD